MFELYLLTDTSFIEELAALCFEADTSFCGVIFTVSKFDHLLTIEANNN